MRLCLVSLFLWRKEPRPWLWTTNHHSAQSVHSRWLISSHPDVLQLLFHKFDMSLYRILLVLYRSGSAYFGPLMTNLSWNTCRISHFSYSYFQNLAPPVFPQPLGSCQKYFLMISKVNNTTICLTVRRVLPGGLNASASMQFSISFNYLISLKIVVRRT